MVPYKIFFFFFLKTLRHADYETGGSGLDYGNLPKGKLSPQGGFFFFLLTEWGWEMYWGRQFLSKEEITEQE